MDNTRLWWAAGAFVLMGLWLDAREKTNRTESVKSNVPSIVDDFSDAVYENATEICNYELTIDGIDGDSAFCDDWREGNNNYRLSY
mgnify:CR=1 FL=1|jgi:hypothetical protein